MNSVVNYSIKLFKVSVKTVVLYDPFLLVILYLRYLFKHRSQWERLIFALPAIPNLLTNLNNIQMYHYVHPGRRCEKFGFNRISRYGSARA